MSGRVRHDITHPSFRDWNIRKNPIYLFNTGRRRRSSRATIARVPSTNADRKTRQYCCGLPRNGYRATVALTVPPQLKLQSCSSSSTAIFESAVPLRLFSCRVPHVPGIHENLAAATSFGKGRDPSPRHLEVASAAEVLLYRGESWAHPLRRRRAMEVMHVNRRSSSIFRLPQLQIPCSAS